MELGLKGKTVIVTGGASNIGRGISLAFAEEGSNVVIAEIDEAQGKKVAAQCEALEKGGRCIVVKTDVTRMEEVESMFKKSAGEFGKIDVLVNVVGWDSLMLFKDMPPETWNKIVSLTYVSVLNGVKTALPYMIAQGGGSIVTIGSDAGRVGEVREAVYSGAKGAVIAFSKAVAKETGRYGIRLNVVCPGVTVPVADEMGKDSMWKELGTFFTPETLKSVQKAYPLGRTGTPEDTAKATVFLASDAASFITGQTLSVSGGYTTV
jgi:2-hydroxycyclohexanecarboxyl-CoA dehydrogenase